MNQPFQTVGLASCSLLFVLLSGGALLHAQSETLSPEMQSRLQRLVELRAEESRLLEGLSSQERETLLRALADQLARERQENTNPPEALIDPPPSEIAPPQEETPEDLVPTLPSRCNTLLPFDTNGDGRFSGADRHFRNFRLWQDSNGNGQPEDEELVPLLPAGVRSLDMDLRGYTNKKGGSGEVFVEDVILIELVAKRGRRESYVLGIAAAPLADDGFRIEDAKGQSLEGTVILRPGLALTSPEGERLALDCP